MNIFSVQILCGFCQVGILNALHVEVSVYSARDQIEMQHCFAVINSCKSSASNKKQSDKSVQSLSSFLLTVLLCTFGLSGLIFVLSKSAQNQKSFLNWVFGWVSQCGTKCVLGYMKRHLNLPSTAVWHLQYSAGGYVTSTCYSTCPYWPRIYHRCFL